MGKIQVHGFRQDRSEANRSRSAVRLGLAGRTRHDPERDGPRVPAHGRRETIMKFFRLGTLPAVLLDLGSVGAAAAGTNTRMTDGAGSVV